MCEGHLLPSHQSHRLLLRTLQQQQSSWRSHRCPLLHRNGVLLPRRHRCPLRPSHCAPSPRRVENCSHRLRLRPRPLPHLFDCAEKKQSDCCRGPLRRHPYCALSPRQVEKCSHRLHPRSRPLPPPFDCAERKQSDCCHGPPRRPPRLVQCCSPRQRPLRFVLVGS